MPDPYIDLSYYRAMCPADAAVDDTTVAALIGRACDLIDVATTFLIPEGGGFDALDAGTKARVQRAAGYQTEYLLQNSGFETANSGQGVASDSASIGKFSIKQRVTSKQQEADPRLCPMAISMLEPTGLLTRAVGAQGANFMGYGAWPIW